MHGVQCFSVFSLLFTSAYGLSLQHDATVIPAFFDSRLPSLASDECDPTAIPVMESFDMKKFSGAWFELSKSASGYIDVNDGMWRIQTTNTSTIFLFSGRDSNAHCIRPIKGQIHASDQPPGLLTLHYKTYSNHVEGPCKVDDVGFQIDDFPVPDFCYQPKDLGFCRGNLQRFYYDPQTRNCEAFTYHGCGGNRNNFMSLPECQEKCLPVSSKESVCMSIAKCAIHCAPCCTEDRAGCVECNCEDVIEDNFLDCKKSPALCQPECLVKEFFLGCYVCSCKEENEPFIDNDNDIPECLEVKKEGNCKEHTERYYYNAITEKCTAFMYSGCNGNKNNFETIEQCIEKCIPDSILEAEDYDGDAAMRSKYNAWLTGSLLLLLIIFTRTNYHRSY